VQNRNALPHFGGLARSLRTHVARATALALVVGSAGLAGVAAAPGAQAVSTGCPWVGSSAPIPDRVSELMSKMSLAQEVGMMTGVFTNWSSYAGVTAPIGSLCIPEMNLEDGPAGVGDQKNDVTQLPAPVDAAATWDTSAEQTYGRVIGAEQAAKGTTVDLGPTINIVRDPRWGRAFESIGEDPYLAGQLGAADIRGVQSTGTMAQVKHFAVYNQETNRNTPQDDAIVSDQALQEIYLPAFKAAVQQGAASSVMCSYSTINGEPACQNQLLNTVLRQEFGFTGFVTSDWGATQSTVASANAGLDQDMPGDDGYYGSALQSAVTSGQVSKSKIDTAVSQILTGMFAFGLFDKAPSGSLDATATNATDQSDSTALAEEGTVLLKNSGNVLPLAAGSGSSIAVVGNWESGGGGSASVNASGTVVSPQAGIAAAAGPGVNVQYAQGSTTDSTLADIPAGALTPSSGSGSGLTGEYFNNMTLSGSPVTTANASSMDLNWNGGSPATGVNATQWSAKFTGTLTAPATGVYTIASASDDGSRVTVDNKLLVNQWQDQAAATASGSIYLTAGQQVPVEVDYYQDGGGSSLNLQWTPANYTDANITQAVALAKNSSTAVVFAMNYEQEGNDLSDIELSGDQNQLIADVAAANPNTVVVLNTGSAVTMPWLSQVKGVLEAWYPGETEGTAIANVLFGDYNPSGHLTVTFPTSLAQAPVTTAAQWPGVNGQVQYSEGVDVGYRWYDSQGDTPLFPFGYGLSYTSFSYSNLHISTLPQGGAATVTATVTNTGKSAGADVAQLYVTDPAASGQPPRQLEGFARVNLAPGQSQTVSFPVTQQNLQYWNTSSNGWATSTGNYGISVGDSSASLPLTGTLPVSSSQLGAPVTLTDPGSQEQVVGAPVNLTLSGSDSTSGQSLTYSAGALPTGVSLDASTGVISGSPTTAGTSTVTVTATDGNAATASQSFLWTVEPSSAGIPVTPLVGYGGLCLDVKGNNNAPGTPVDVYTCNGSNAQQWTVEPDGTVQADGNCLDVQGGGTADTTPVDLYTCNGTGAQNWVPQSDGALLNPQSGDCLVDPGDSTTPATQLQISSCDGKADQSWTSPAARTGTVTGYEGLCLDVQGGVSDSGTPILVYSCNGTSAQQWTVELNGTLQAFGKCLDITGDQNYNGSPVDLYTCNGTSAQDWQPLANGELLNPQTGRCLDDNSFGGSGTHLFIYDCNDGANQKWTLP
jgi:beta-glucosidase